MTILYGHVCNFSNYILTVVYYYAKMTSMNSHNISKINFLLKAWPRGTVATQVWLQKQGVYRQLAQTYCKSDWIKRIGQGAYIQSTDSVDWTGALYALQKELRFKVTVAAITALEMAGTGHYIPLNKRSTLWLFKASEESRKLPHWFVCYVGERHDLQCVTRHLFSGQWETGLVEKRFGEYTVFISSPERAIMEVLDLAPNDVSLEQATILMEKLRTLRPQLVQQLLENCESVKVKRLFLYLAETQGHPWFNRLKLSSIDLGKGKRIIGEGGKFIPKYQLSLPDIDAYEG